jgi:hypothetical protein
MPIEIRSVVEVEPLLVRVRAAADVTARRLRDLAGAANDGLTVLRRLKFSEFGRHPVEDRDINLIEDRQVLLETLPGIEVWGIDV